MKCRFCSNESECTVEILTKNGRKILYLCWKCSGKWDVNGIVTCRGCGNLYLREEEVNGKQAYTYIPVCELCDRSRVRVSSSQLQKATV